MNSFFRYKVKFSYGRAVSYKVLGIFCFNLKIGEGRRIKMTKLYVKTNTKFLFCTTGGLPSAI
jgi:hypothetical protein